MHGTDRGRAQSRAGRAPGRRAVLSGGAVATLGLLGLPGDVTVSGRAVAGRDPARARHQRGIADPPLPFLALAGLDVLVSDRAGLRTVLRAWTDVVPEVGGPDVTVTIGVGPSLFDARGLVAGARCPPGARRAAGLPR